MWISEGSNRRTTTKNELIRNKSKRRKRMRKRKRREH